MIEAIFTGRVERLAVKAHGPRAAEVEAWNRRARPGRFARGRRVRQGRDRPVHESVRQRLRPRADGPFGRGPRVLALARRPLLSRRAMRSRGRLVGVMTLVQAWSGRRHDEDDALFTRASPAGSRSRSTSPASSPTSERRNADGHGDDARGACRSATAPMIFVNEAAVALVGPRAVEAARVRAGRAEIRHIRRNRRADRPRPLPVGARPRVRRPDRPAHPSAARGGATADPLKRHRGGGRAPHCRSPRSRTSPR